MTPTVFGGFQRFSAFPAPTIAAAVGRSLEPEPAEKVEKSNENRQADQNTFRPVQGLSPFVGALIALPN
jgi:hypothetical protein